MMMNTVFRMLLILALALSAQALFAAEEDAKPSEEQLASVLALPFINETGLKQYDWLANNVPKAIIDSMQEKFRFSLMTEQEAFSKPIKKRKFTSLKFSALITEEQAAQLCKETGADIIVYGKYNYKEVDKTIDVNASIFHRSRGRVTGNIDMTTPVTSEMFKLVDTVADRAVLHIAEVAKQDAELAGAPVEPVSDKKEDAVITLVKREGPVSKPFYVYAGAAYSMPLTFFDTGIGYLGGGLTGGFMNGYTSFWHWGANASLLVYRGNPDDPINIIDAMILLPVTVTGGINFNVSPSVTIQPYIGGGGALAVIITGEETLLYEGQPVREGDAWKFYVHPCVSVGVRVPIIFGEDLISPFIQVYGFIGEAGTHNKEYKIGTLLLAGAEYMF
jgi:TolB-like protein